MIRHNYAELFADDPLWLPRAKALAARTYEFTEYLVDVLGMSDFGARWTAHSPIIHCHLQRGLGLTASRANYWRTSTARKSANCQKRKMLRLWRDLFRRAPELSAEMLKRKIKNSKLLSPHSGCLRRGCLMHIQADCIAKK